MDKHVEVILERICAERRIAYLVTDRNMRIVDTGGLTNLIAHGTLAFERKQLTKVLPALQAYSEGLTGLIAGRETRLEIPRLAVGESDSPVSIVILPNRDAQGIVAGLLLIVEELHGRFEAEKTLAAESKTDANMQSEFVAVAAQALRSPLTVASLYLQMIETGMYGAISPTLQDNLDKVTGALDRLMLISKNMQDAARLDTDQIVLALQPVDLRQIIHSVVEAVSASYADKLHLISIKLPPALPYVQGDVTRLQQVITNLLTNACKYTPERGRITVTARRLKNDFVQLAVIDNGMGVPPEDKEKLFSRFYRTASAFESGETGAGLGLYITRSLVEMHGGEIWFEANEDAGTTFNVTLPVALQQG